jgi:hypothetical protein
MKRVPFFRRKFLIDPEFQLKMAFMLASWFAICGLVFLFTLLTASDSAIEMVRSHDNHALADMMLAQRNQLVVTVAILQVISLVGILLLGVLISHRLVGPVMKIEDALRKWGSGEAPEKLQFRKNDAFHSLAEAYNSAREVSMKSSRSINS